MRELEREREGGGGGGGGEAGGGGKQIIKMQCVKQRSIREE